MWSYVFGVGWQAETGQPGPGNRLPDQDETVTDAQGCSLPVFPTNTPHARASIAGGQYPRNEGFAGVDPRPWHPDTTLYTYLRPQQHRHINKPAASMFRIGEDQLGGGVAMPQFVAMLKFPELSGSPKVCRQTPG